MIRSLADSSRQGRCAHTVRPQRLRRTRCFRCSSRTRRPTPNGAANGRTCPPNGRGPEEAIGRSADSRRRAGFNESNF